MELSPISKFPLPYYCLFVQTLSLPLPLRLPATPASLKSQLHPDPDSDLDLLSCIILPPPLTSLTDSPLDSSRSIPLIHSLARPIQSITHQTLPHFVKQTKRQFSPRRIILRNPICNRPLPTPRLRIPFCCTEAVACNCPATAASTYQISSTSPIVCCSPCKSSGFRGTK